MNNYCNFITTSLLPIEVRLYNFAAVSVTEGLHIINKYIVIAN